MEGVMSGPDKTILAQADKFVKHMAELREKRKQVVELEAQLEWGALMHYLWKARGGDVDKKSPLTATVTPKGAGTYTQGYYTITNGDKRRSWPVSLHYDNFTHNDELIDMWDNGEIPERLIEIVLTKNGKHAVHYARKKRLRGEQERGRRTRGPSLEYVAEERSESGVWVASLPGDDGLPEVAEEAKAESP
jgi:hypothetical protein